MPIDGREHTCVRSYTRGGTADAKIFVDGDIVANGSAGVAEYLAEKGIDLDGFNMVYAQQGELSYFVDTTPAIRKQLISSLLQLDKFDEMIKQVRSDVKEQEVRLRDIPERERIEELVGQIQELEEEVAQATEEAYTLDNFICEQEGDVNPQRS
jgi:DNA repair exonuclease SbcCD ATPase subunit